jgi:hypothetical protein
MVVNGWYQLPILWQQSSLMEYCSDLTLDQVSWYFLIVFLIIILLV